jgi:ATP-dependent helicase HrpB
VRIVVDSGLARVPRYEPDVGLTSLETVRVSRASADQRRGRAGRIESGVCYRLWDEPQTASLAATNVPEILAADLSSLALDLAHWGVADPATLAFLDPPPRVALNEAKALLSELGAIDRDGRITEEGQKLRRLPLPPRLARMVVDAGDDAPLAADIALLLTERGLGGNDVDLAHRLDEFRRDRSRRAQDARAMARRWAEIARTNTEGVIAKEMRHDRRAPSPREPSRGRVGVGGRAITQDDSIEKKAPTDPSPPFAARMGGGERRGPSRGSEVKDRGELSPGLLLALAYPDRIAKARSAGGAFLLANGRGANLDPASALSREPFLAVGEIAGTAAQGRILLAAALTLGEIEAYFAARIESRDDVVFDEQSLSLRGRQARRLGSLALAERPMKVEPNDDTARLLAEGIARAGIGKLPWTKSLLQWRDRVMFLRRAEGDEWPDLSDAALGADADWLASLCAGKTALAAVSAEEFGEAVRGLIPWNLRRRLDAEAPTHFAAPSGSSVPIDYEAEEGPKLSIRVQELFGLDRHPAIAGGRVPLVIELLSPAHRPVQVTRDLPGFWRGSYAAVKAEMKGRYPRHPWPDDPLSAPATRRAKPRAQ